MGGVGGWYREVEKPGRRAVRCGEFSSIGINAFFFLSLSFFGDVSGMCVVWYFLALRNRIPCILQHALGL